MRYALTAAAVASLAAGSFAGVVHNHANAHQHLHERDAQPGDPDWKTVQYTFSKGQCYGTWGCDNSDSPATNAPVAAAPTYAPAVATGAPAPPANNAPVQAQSAPTQPAAPVISKASSAISSIASAVSPGQSSGGSFSADSILNLVTGNGGSTIKAASPDGSVCAEGADLKNAMDISNQSGEDFVWTCWPPAGSWVNANAPLLTLPIPSGNTKTISFADTPSGSQGPGCAPVFKTNTLNNWGQIYNTWLEATFNQWGTINVSREVAMKGHAISVNTAAKCTTSMDRCVFKCNDPNAPGSCGDPGTYSLQSCPNDGTANVSPADGGCQIGNGKASVTVGPYVGTY